MDLRANFLQLSLTTGPGRHLEDLWTRSAYIGVQNAPTKQVGRPSD